MKALLTNYHQAPRKVRLVADLIRGKRVEEARVALAFLPKKSSPAIAKLLESAVANAKQSGASADELFVKTITVNKGMVLKRFMPKARGSAARYQHAMSIVAIELGTNAASKKATKKTAKKAAPKKTASKKVAQKKESEAAAA